MRITTAGLAALALLSPTCAWADEPEPNEAKPNETELSEAKAFELGTITVTGTREPGIAIGSGSVSAEAILAFERQTLDEAARLVPGVTASNTGGSRNEQLIFVRGFDRFQVPLSIDGVRIYLPADNRLDLGRFLTADIAQVQVAKGFVSVIDGPGALGGAINLVTRTPSKQLELEARASLSLDRNVDASGHALFSYAGTRQANWYAQVSGATTERDFFTLAAGFQPTPNQGAGRRDLSDTRDWRINARIGYVPAEGHELALSYTRQEGAKNAPIETTVPLPVQRFWAWPEWNIETLVLHAATPLGSDARLEGRVYRSQFDNLLRAFDNRTQTSQTLPRAFNSFYEDEAIGGTVELAVDLTQHQALTLAAHIRRDEHVEFQQSFPSGATEPRQTSLETTWSLAGEHRIALAPSVSLRTGLSYDRRVLHRAEDFGTPSGGGSARVFAYPTRNGDAWNAQGQIEWQPDDANGLAFSVSSRARFPTLFDRFSSRFGGATSNPGLEAERATQIELSGSHRRGPLVLEAAVYVAAVRDAIFAVPTLFYPCTNSTTPPALGTPGCDPQAISQSRNVGSGTYWGADGAITFEFTPHIRAGASATFVQRDIADPNQPAFRPVGVPDISWFLWASWQPAPELTILPSIDLAGDRWIVNTSGTRWQRDGTYAIASLRVAWEPIANLELAVSGRNLFDQNFQLAEGFPAEGRSFQLSARARY